VADPAHGRRTLAGPASVSGRGLFTGLESTLRLLPAKAGRGIRVRRADSPGLEYPAHVERVFTSANLPGRNTCLSAEGGSAPVLTVEHVLSALTGLGVTDAVLEVSGYEAPIGDGSASLFVEAMRTAGLEDLGGSLEPLVITRDVEARYGESWILARPRPEGCLYRYELDYGPGAPLAAQSAEVALGVPGAGEVYAREVAPARTFCLEAEARQMQSTGLFRHFTTRDLLVIGELGPIDNELRFENEPARHKLLDLIGDLALVGRPIRGEIVAHRAGHALNHAMARELLKRFG
jgi:UDP-3-O-acyl N-acetylglucosamine deacetylase